MRLTWPVGERQPGKRHSRLVLCRSGILWIWSRLV